MNTTKTFTNDETLSEIATSAVLSAAAIAVGSYAVTTIVGRAFGVDTKASKAYTKIKNKVTNK